MQDANYCVMGSGQSFKDNSEGATFCVKAATNTSAPTLLSTTQVRMMYRGTFNETRADALYIYAAIFR
jgi:hypothetical protein